ncbi:MAG: ABC transporter permease [Deltaproteobacteria bacterium HGW-Deltaproteobacteria-15]|jgi:ABC-type lipoprotein release transport system permease subunit|nr:MAG: ABC transporter permease [Deltaproteobacteria bacterium HGW-Deltaproteobacteria-15]
MRKWVERQRNVIDFTIAALSRRKGKNLALISVYTFVVMLLASVVFFTGALKKEASMVLAEAPEIVVQRQVVGRHDFIPIRYAERIRRISGVASVKERLWGYYYMAGANYTVMTRDDFSDEVGTVVIGQGVSRTLQIQEGDALALRGHEGMLFNFDVKEILPAASELVSADLIILSEQDFRDFFGLEKGVATDLTVRVRNPREVATVAAKVAEILPDTRPIIREEIARTYDAVFDWRGGVIIVVVATALLAFVIFSFEKASGLSAEEKREIGTLKAIGWETGDVIAMKLWEAVAVSLTAFLLGMVFAYLHVFVASAPLFEQVLRGWSILYPEFRLTPFISPYELTTLFFLTVVPYIVATIIPSWRASIVDPDSIMRS